MAIELGSAHGKVELDAKGVKKGVKQSQDALGGLEKSIEDVFKFSMGNLVAQGIGQLIGGVRDLYSETRELSTGFESQMAVMSTAVDPAVASLDTLHDAAIAVGGDIGLVGIDAQQAAGAMTELFKSGKDVNDVFGDMEGYMAGTAALSGILRASVDMQAASALNLAAATGLVNATLATYELGVEQATAVTDNFVQTADASQAEVEDLAAAHENAAIVVASFGYSLEDTNTTLALLSENSLKGAEAGTSLKAMLNNMLRPTTKVKDAWDELGVALYDHEGQLKRLPQLITELVPALQGLTEERRNELVYLLAGSDGQRALNILLSKGAEGWRQMERAIADAATAQEVAAARANTLQGAEEALEGTLETLKIQVGEEFIPVWTALVQGFTAFADEHGPRVVSAASAIADGVLAVVEGLGHVDPALVSTIAQMTGLATVLGTGYVAFTKLIPVVGSLNTVLAEAVAGMQLMASGATAAEVATLGVSAALGPIVIGLGAVTLALVAANKALQLHQDVQERTAQTSDEWAVALERMAENANSATAVVEAYANKQTELNGILETGGAGAALFIDKQAVLNARAEDLNATLTQSANSYADYRAAVDQVNATVVEAATYINTLGITTQDTGMIAEHSIAPLNAIAFAIARGEMGANDSAEAYDQYNQALVDSEKATAAAVRTAKLLAASNETVALTAAENAALYDQLSASLENFGLSQQTIEQAQTSLGVQMGLTSNLANMQANAINVLAYEYSQGHMTLQAYMAAGEQIKLVNADSLEGYQAVADVVADATGSYALLGTAAGDLPSKLYAMQNAALANAAAQEEMAQRAEQAWASFADNVRNGVGAALEAYKSGNDEMLAEQQQALGELLWGQTDQMLALGQISQDQALAMKSTIAGEFGVVVDEVQVTTDALLGMFADWSAGGQTSADEIVAFIQNIGTESEALVVREETAINQQITHWENLDTSVAGVNERLLAKMDELGSSTETQGGAMETALRGVGSASQGMAGQVEGSASQAAGAIDKIGNAIDDLPGYKLIEIEVQKTGDDAFDFGSPQFRFYYALQDLVQYAKRNQVAIDVASRMDGGMALHTSAALLSPMTAPLTGGSSTTSYDQRKWELNMPVTALQDAVDIELLAQQLLALIRSHQ